MRLVALARGLQISAGLALGLFVNFGTANFELKNDAFCHLNVDDAFAHRVLRDSLVIAQLADEWYTFGVQLVFDRVFVGLFRMPHTQLLQCFLCSSVTSFVHLQFERGGYAASMAFFFGLADF